MRWRHGRTMEQLEDVLIEVGWSTVSVSALSNRILERNGASKDIVEILEELKEVEECSPGSRQAVDN